MPLKSWNPYYLAVYYGAQVFTKTFGSLEVVGEENIPAGGCVFASNHVSHLDPPLVGSCIPREIHFLARKTLFKGAVGKVISNTNAIPVDLEKGLELSTFKSLLSLAGQGESVLIFPEGTRSATGEMQDPKGGTGMLACKLGLTVVPVRIFGAFELLPRGSSFPFPGARVTVVFGKPMLPTEFDPGKVPGRYLVATQCIMDSVSRLEAPPVSIA